MKKLHLGRAGLLSSTALQAAFVLLPLSARAQPAANAQPGGGQVVAGAASIAQSASTTTITQSSQRAAINWQSFNIGAQQSVQFQQPSSSATTLNRVVGPNPSQIAGRIQANGQVIITNQDGVTFYKGAQVNAAGLMVSSAGISTDNFMAGRLVFNQAGNPNAAIVNAGTITIKQAGLAALVAPQVVNSGVITATMGHVILAGAQAATVDLYGDGLVALDVTKQVTQVPVGRNGRKVTALVTNTGTILAPGGSVQLTAQQADGLVQDLVQAGGTIAADSVGGHTGQIVVNGIGGSVIIAGTLSAQGTAAGSTGGRVVVAPSGTVVVGRHGAIDVSGAAGGGTVLLGATSPATPVSAAVLVAPGAQISANATQAGAGGRVVLHPTGLASLAGTVSATGGPQGGNGGSLEVSGSSAGASGLVDLSAPLGAAGTVLFDPATLTIVSGTGTYDSGFNGTILSPASLPPDTVSSTVLQGWTASAIVLQATSLIDVQATVSVSQNLTLQSGGDITVEATGGLTTTGDLVLQAAYDFVTNTVTAGAGGIALLGSAAIGGANVLLAAGTTGISLGSGTVTTGGVLDVSTFGGGVSQNAAGVISATILQSSAGVTGTAALPGGNNIGTLTNFAVTNGEVILDNGTNALVLAGLNIPGALELTTGTLSESGFGVLVGTLGGTVQGDANLFAPLNYIGTIAGLTTTRSLVLADDENLTLAGTVNIGTTLTLYGQNLVTQGTAASLTAAAISGGPGTLLLTGSNDVASLVDLLTGGDVTLNNGSNVLTLGAIVTVPGRLNLTAGSVQESAATLSVNTLSGTIAGTVSLGGNNTIGTLSGLSVGGDLVLNDGTTPLAIAGSVGLGSNAFILNAGSLTEDPIAGTLVTGILSGTIAGGSLAGTNAIASLVNLTSTGDLALNDGTTGLQFAGSVNLGSHALSVTAGTLGQTAGSIIAGTLTGSISGVVDLAGGSNAIAAIGPFGAIGAATIADTGVLLLQGLVSAGSTLQIGTTGTLTSAGTLDAPVIMLNGLAIEQSSGSILAGSLAVLNAGTGGIGLTASLLSAPTLSLSDTGALAEGTGEALHIGTVTGLASAIGLTAGSNTIAVLSGLTAAGSLALIDTGPLTLSGSVVAGTVLSLQTNGTLTALASAAVTAGTLLLSSTGGIVSLGSAALLDAPLTTLSGANGIQLGAGVVTATTTLELLTSAGDLTQGSNGMLDVGMLVGSIVGSVDLAGTANLIGAIGPFGASGAVTIADTGALLLQGLVSAGSTLWIGTTGTLTSAGTLEAPTIDLSGLAIEQSAGSILAGTLAVLTAGSGGVTLVAGSAISATTLALQSSGPITEDTAATIAASTLTGSITGAALLAGSANTIGTLAGLTVSDDLTLSNSGSLTLAGAIGAADVTIGGGSLTTPSAILLQGSLTVPGLVALTSGGGITQTGGTITAGTLSASAGGSIFLAAQGNDIGTLQNSSATSDLAVVDGADLTIAGSLTGADLYLAVIQPGATLHLAATADLTATAPGGNVVLVADRLTDDTGLNISGAITGATVALAPFSDIPATLGAGTGLVWDSILLAAIDAQVLWAGHAPAGAFITPGEAAGLTLAGAVLLPGIATLDLRSTAGVEQSIGSLSVPVLASSLGIQGDVRLQGTNQVGTLGNFAVTGGNFNLLDGEALSVAGEVSGGNVAISGPPTITVTGSIGATATIALASTGSIGVTAGAILQGPDIILAGGGPLSLAGSLLAGAEGTLDLFTSSGGLSAAAAVLSAGTLLSSSGITGDADFSSGGNTIAVLAGIAVSGSLVLADTADLQVTGPASAAHFVIGGDALATPPGLGITGSLIADTVLALTSGAGGINLGSAAVVSAPTIIAATPGLIALTGNASLGAGGETLDLSSTGSSLTEASTAVMRAALLTSSQGIGGDAILAGTANTIAGIGGIGVGGLLAVNDTGNLAVSGAVSAANAILAVGGALAIPSAIAVPGTLTLLAGGAITEPGSIRAATLTGQSGQATALTGSNAIADLADFSAPGGVALSDGSDLLVSGVVAGGPDISLTVHGNLTIAGMLGAGMVGLTATNLLLPGDIIATNLAILAISGDVSGAGQLVTDDLTGQAGNISLTGGSNQVAALTNLATGTLTLQDSTNLQLLGTISATLAQIDVGLNSLTIASGTELLTAGTARPGGRNVSLPSASSGAGAYFSFGQFVQLGSSQVGSVNGTPPILVLTAVNGGSFAFDTSAGLSAPSTWLVLNYAASGNPQGTASGNIDVAALDVVYSPGAAGGGANLYGIVNGTAGPGAAGQAHIQPKPSANFLLNNCPIAATSCVVLSHQAVPAAGNPLNYIFIDTMFGFEDEEDFLQPIVSDEDY